jgi:tetratricopeptide (TPR) repeat protein
MGRDDSDHPPAGSRGTNSAGAELEDDLTARRRRLVGWSGVGLLAIFGIWVTLGPLAGDPPCSMVERELEGVWDAGVGARVRIGIEATGATYAPDAADDVERVLGQYSAAWVKMRTAACEAKKAGVEQSPALLDLRLRCLDRRLGELGALAELLAGADQALVARAARAVRALGSIEDCADTETLSRIVPLPDDPQQRSRIAALTSEVARVDALAEAGRYGEALEQARALVEPSTATGYQPLRAEVLLLVGGSQDTTGDAETAAETIREAALAAEAGRDDDLAARAWARLVYVTGVELAHHDQAHRWAERAAAAAARTASSRHGATVAYDLGRVLMSEGRYEEAYEQFASVLVEREARLGPDHYDVTVALGAMATALQRQGEAAEATALDERVLAISEQTLGPSHPDVAHAHRSLALALRDRRRLTAAIEHHHAALEIFETAFGPDDESVAAELVSLAEALVELGKPNEAVEHLERALAVNQAALPENDPTLAANVYALGLAHETAGRDAAALEAMRRALAMREAMLGPAHVDVGINHCAIGRVQLKLGRTREALAELQHGLAIIDTAVGPASPRRAEALIPLAELGLAIGAPALAIAPLEEAVDGWGGAVDPVVRARAKFALAKLLWEAGRGPEHGRAIDLAEDARFALSKAGEGLEDEKARIGDWLAERDGDELP